MTKPTTESPSTECCRCGRVPAEGEDHDFPALAVSERRRFCITAACDDIPAVDWYARAREMEAERDALAAKLAEVEAAATRLHGCGLIPADPHTPATWDRDVALLRLAMSAPAPTALARVREDAAREALEAAADVVDGGPNRDPGPFCGDTLPHEFASWLRTRAQNGGSNG